MLLPPSMTFEVLSAVFMDDGLLLQCRWLSEESPSTSPPPCSDGCRTCRHLVPSQGSSTALATSCPAGRATHTSANHALVPDSVSEAALSGGGTEPRAHSTIPRGRGVCLLVHQGRCATFPMPATLPKMQWIRAERPHWLVQLTIRFVDVCAGLSRGTRRLASMGGAGRA